MRATIERFWHNGPYLWLYDHITQDVPRTGARLAFGRRSGVTWLDTNKMSIDGVVGRYVHCWTNIGRVVDDDGKVHYCSGGIGSGWLSRWLGPGGQYHPKIGWVIVGGESGPGARLCNVDWIRSIVRQCKNAGVPVPVFIKQLGSKATGRDIDELPFGYPGKGNEPAYWPEDLRVREMPT
jgi:hypothetical protein